MSDLVRVRTEIGVDVLNDQAIVLALCTTHSVADDHISPNAFGPLAHSGDGARLNGSIPLAMAIDVYNKLGDAIEELARRQGVTNA